MDKEFINQINMILNTKKIDERVKPLIKLYFLGKLKTGDLTLEQLSHEVDTLCSRTQNVEFSSRDIVSAYSSKAGILTINKQLLLEGKCDEVILPVFMKFEEILNQNDRRTYSNHIEDFIRAGRISKAISVPISQRLHKLYEMAEYSYGDIEPKVDELVKDGAWKAVCSKYNHSLNKMVITGEDNQKDLLNGISLFHYEVFTSEALENSSFEGPYKSEEYQKKAAKILRCIDPAKPVDSKVEELERNGLINNIKLFTGCTQEMIEKAKLETYLGDSRINSILKLTTQTNVEKVNEDFIVAKVQAVLDKKTKWDNRIKHLVIPFFIRSQKIYDWDADEFQENLNELDLKIDEIVFEDLKSLTTMGDTALGKIRLNSKIFLGRNRKLIFSYNQNSFS